MTLGGIKFIEDVPYEYAVGMTFSADQLVINRKTDSLFDWLGDWGGFLDGLSLIAELLMESYSLYQIKTFLTNLLIRFSPRESEYQNRSAFLKLYKEKENIVSSITSDMT